MKKSKVSMLAAATLSTLFGCSYPLMVEERTCQTQDGKQIIRRVFNDGTVTFQRGYGQPVESDPSRPSYQAAQHDFELAAASNPLEASRKAASAAQERAAASSSPGDEPAAAFPAPAPVGPKIDLPTQIYQPPAGGTSYPPSGGYDH
jgi:hypothetical protein